MQEVNRGFPFSHRRATVIYKLQIKMKKGIHLNTMLTNVSCQKHLYWLYKCWDYILYQLVRYVCIVLEVMTIGCIMKSGERSWWLHCDGLGKLSTEMYFCWVLITSLKTKYTLWQQSPMMTVVSFNRTVHSFTLHN